MHHRPPEPRTSIASAIGWAFYLGCSWTWVIGMYLPALLVRDYGWRGWLAFMVPNVVGAAAMGWVLRSPLQARQILVRHRSAVGGFTIVTVSFQLFALMWLVPRLLGAAGMLLVLVALACALLPSLALTIGNRAIAVVAWLISLVMLGLLGLGGVLEFPPESGLRPDWHLVGLVPACLLGFFLCPYLDATFLLARARTDRQGARVAFTLGFGLVFFVMILFSLLYALPIEESVLERGTAWLLAIHLGVQVCFTCAAHVAVARGQTEVQALVSAPWLMGGVVLAAVLGIAALRADLAGLRLVGMSLGEVLYRSYMGFYGLLFPAYVLICMVGSGSPRLLVVTCLAALPPFVAAFLLGWMPWAAVGAGIILAAGLPTVLRRQKPVS